MSSPAEDVRPDEVGAYLSSDLGDIPVVEFCLAIHSSLTSLQAKEISSPGGAWLGNKYG